MTIGITEFMCYLQQSIALEMPLPKVYLDKLFELRVVLPEQYMQKII